MEPISDSDGVDTAGRWDRGMRGEMAQEGSRGGLISKVSTGLALVSSHLPQWGGAICGPCHRPPSPSAYGRPGPGARPPEVSDYRRHLCSRSHVQGDRGSGSEARRRRSRRKGMVPDLRGDTPT